MGFINQQTERLRAPHCTELDDIKNWRICGKPPSLMRKITRFPVKIFPSEKHSREDSARNTDISPKIRMQELLSKSGIVPLLWPVVLSPPLREIPWIWGYHFGGPTRKKLVLAKLFGMIWSSNVQEMLNQKMNLCSKRKMSDSKPICYSYGPLPVISTKSPHLFRIYIYIYSNPIYNQLWLINGHNCSYLAALGSKPLGPSLAAALGGRTGGPVLQQCLLRRTLRPSVFGGRKDRRPSHCSYGPPKIF